MLAKLNIFDFTVCLFLLISILTGLNRGFISSVFSILGWIAALYLTHMAFPYLEPVIKNRTESEFLAFLFGYLGVLLVLLIFFAIFNFFLVSALGKLHRSLPDRFAGLCFGAIRAYFILGALLAAYSLIVDRLQGPGAAADNDVNSVISQAEIKENTSLKGRGGEEGVAADASGDKAQQNSKNEHGKRGGVADISGQHGKKDLLLPKFIKNSFSFPFLLTSSEVIMEFIPQKFKKNLRQLAGNSNKKEELILVSGVRKMARILDADIVEEVAEYSKELLAKQGSEHDLPLRYITAKEMLRRYKEFCDEDIKRCENGLSKRDLQEIEAALSNYEPDDLLAPK